MTEESLVQVSRDGDITIVEFPARLKHLDELVIADISRGLVAAAETTTAGRLVLDLSNVEFFGSSFIEALFRAWNRLNQGQKGRLVLCCVQDYCREVLEVTHLDRLWPIVPTRDAAIAACMAE